MGIGYIQQTQSIARLVEDSSLSVIHSKDIFPVCFAIT